MLRHTGIHQVNEVVGLRESTSCVAVGSSVCSGVLSSSHFPPLLAFILWQGPGIVKNNHPDYYNNIRRRTWPRTRPHGMTGPAKSPAIKSSKIFSLSNHEGTLLPVLDTVSPSGSLFSINLVSCVTGHFFMEQRNNTFSHEALTRVTLTAAVNLQPQQSHLDQKRSGFTAG